MTVCASASAPSSSVPRLCALLCHTRRRCAIRLARARATANTRAPSFALCARRARACISPAPRAPRAATSRALASPTRARACRQRVYVVLSGERLCLSLRGGGRLFLSCFFIFGAAARDCACFSQYGTMLGSSSSASRKRVVLCPNLHAVIFSSKGGPPNPLSGGGN